MNSVKSLTLVLLLTVVIIVVGCSVKTMHTKGPEVNAQCQMSEEEKEAFADMVAQKVVELQRQ